MNLWNLYWQLVNLLGYYDRRKKKKGAWVVDEEHKLKIDPQTIVLEADRKRSLHFGREAARKEEAAILLDNLESSANGRYWMWYSMQ